MGGCTAAYYLRRLLNDRVAITLFEQSGRIGGRMRTVNIDGELYETGASIFHGGNKYMVDLAKEFKLPVLDMRSGAKSLAIYDGYNNLAYTTVNQSRFFGRLRFLFNYGFSFLRTRQSVTNLVKKFTNVYDLQDKGCCFTTPAHLLAALSPEFLRLTTISFGQHLRNTFGVSNRFKDEMGFGFVSNCYTQGLDVHAFVGMIACAGSKLQLSAIAGGNERLPKAILDESLKGNPIGAPTSFVHAKVTTLKQGSKKNYCLEYTPGNGGSSKSQEFDYVILAMPLHQESTLSSSGHLLPAKPTQYCITETTKIKGLIEPSHFGIPANAPPGQLQKMTIFPTRHAYEEDPMCLFRSIIFQQSVAENAKETDGCWGIFTSKNKVIDPVKSLLGYYTEGSRVLHSHRWLAYPVYTPVKNPADELGTFVLAPGLFYANAIEKIASCMEIAAIGGRNVALLVHNEVMLTETHNDVKKCNLVDPVAATICT